MANDSQRGFMDSTPNDAQRISISLATLQAELGKLELRLVDRLNASLEGKAERVVQEQHTRELADVSSRISRLEQNAITRDDAVAKQVEQNAADIRDLKVVAGYKKWLWVQTVALIAIAVPLLGFLIDHWTTSGTP